MSTTDMNIRVLIADRQPACRRRLRSALESTEPGYQVEEAADGRTAAALIRSSHPSVLVLDLALPGRADVEALLKADNGGSGLFAIATLATVDRAQVMEAIRLGARGVVRRSAAINEIVRAVRNAASGRYCFDHDALAVLVQSIRCMAPPASNGTTPLRTDYALTPRELEIVDRITAGLSNRMVSREFSISERTVKHHLTNIFNKVGVSTRLELAARFSYTQQLVRPLERSATAGY